MAAESRQRMGNRRSALNDSGWHLYANATQRTEDRPKGRTLTPNGNQEEEEPNPL